MSYPVAGTIYPIRRSAQALTTTLLERIAKRTPGVHAVVATCPETALIEAIEADRARDRGTPSPLDGMPIVIKDNIDVAGLPCRCGSTFFADRRPTTEATVVGLLRRAGAVILGKSQTTEFMLGLAPHPAYPPCRNPWDLERIAGPSSSGSAAALADGQAIGALGTDTGGSVRIPAAFTGTTGLRPTFGTISTTGVFPVAPSLDTVGPMARSAADVTRLHQVLARHDPGDPAPRPPRPDPVPVPAEGTRIGVPGGFFLDDCDPEIEAMVRDAVAEFRRWGHGVVEVDLPLAATAARDAITLAHAEALATHRRRLADRPGDFGALVRERLRLGATITRADLDRVRERTETWKRSLARVFETVDIIVTPTTPVLPPSVEEAEFGLVKDLTRFTYLWALAGVPALAMPCGISRSGLPIGLQVVGAPFSDPHLLAFARHVQTRTDWHLARPTAER